MITGSNLGGITAMYRVPAAGGTPRRLDFAGDNPWFLDVSRRGNRLAYTRLQRDINVYAAELGSDGALASTGQVVASSSRRDMDGVFSPDGSRIAVASDRDGSSEIWITTNDGRNPLQLTANGRAGVLDAADAPEWSPDGSQIAFVSRLPDGGPPDVFVISAAGGPARRVTDNPGRDIAPSWSADGKTIYFISNRGGSSGRDGATRVWAVPAGGGAARQLSPTPVLAMPAFESPDGQWVYFRSAEGIARVSPTGRDEALVVKGSVYSFRPTSRGLFYLTRPADVQSAELRLVPLTGGASRTLGTIPHTVFGAPSFSPDFSHMLYARCDQCAADIMLVANFR